MSAHGSEVLFHVAHIIIIKLDVGLVEGFWPYLGDNRVYYKSTTSTTSCIGVKRQGFGFIEMGFKTGDALYKSFEKYQNLTTRKSK